MPRNYRKIHNLGMQCYRHILRVDFHSVAAHGAVRRRDVDVCRELNAPPPVLLLTLFRLLLFTRVISKCPSLLFTMPGLLEWVKLF